MLKIGLIGAMSIEIKHLQAVLENSVKMQKAQMDFYEGTVKGIPVVLVQSGVGKVNAALCASILIQQFNVSHIINTGVAGGIEKDLNIFDIVISSDALYHDMDVRGFGYKACEIPGMNVYCFKADPFLISCAEKAWQKANFTQKLIRGRIGTGDVFVNSAEKKEEIRLLCNPACIEMEGAAVAHVSYLNDVPFLIIRCISDMAENTQEVYHEEKAARISGFLVEQITAIIGSEFFAN